MDMFGPRGGLTIPQALGYIIVVIAILVAMWILP